MSEILDAPIVNKIVSRKFHLQDSHTLKVVREHGAYNAVEDALAKSEKEIRDIILESGLRGKGGGGASAGKKWHICADYKKEHDFGTSYLVVNADESEPGTFKDRRIITEDPHLLIEGMIITSYAIGAKHAYIYIRGEYIEHAQILQNAIDEAYTNNLLGENAPYPLDITLHRGGGAYICGEKSALLESLEGNRGHPRLKPHQPEPEFYFGQPTLVNNVETIASVPFIVKHGAEAYRAVGTKESPGTLLFAISGHINTPGVYEAAFGMPMLEYINSFGGGMKNGKKLKAVIPGGASCPVMTAQMVEKATLDYETLRGMKTALGTGGMIVMDEDTSMVKALKNLMHFYHHESCGQCTPCREGTGWVDKLMDRFVAKKATEEDIETLLSLADTMNGKTICVFAPAAAAVIQAFLLHFRDEFEACVVR